MYCCVKKKTHTIIINRCVFEGKNSNNKHHQSYVGVDLVPCYPHNPSLTPFLYPVCVDCFEKKKR